MSTVKEREDNNKKVDAVIILACNGDKQAEKYMADLVWCARRIDDLYDRDCYIPKEEIELLFRKLLIDIPTNPFYLKNYQVLVCQQMIFYNAWMDANRWEDDKEELKRIYAHVFRDSIDDIIRLISFITGGFDKTREISLVSRETFIKEI